MQHTHAAAHSWLPLNKIAPKYRMQFIKNTSLKNLEENMKYLGYYSFKVFDLENKVVQLFILLV